MVGVSALRESGEVDFDPIRGMETRGYRLAPIDVLTPSSNSGDAYLLCPDGRCIDLYWRASQRAPAAHWEPPAVAGGLGVITVEVEGEVRRERDLLPVLDAAVVLMDPIIAAGIESPS